MFEFLLEVKEEATLLFLGSTTLMMVFGIMLWLQIKDIAFLFYAVFSLLTLLYFSRNTNLIDFLVNEFGWSEQLIWRYTENSLGLGMTIFYLLFIYNFLQFYNHFNARTLVLIRLSFALFVILVVLEWIFLFGFNDIEASTKLQQIGETVVIIPMYFALYLGFKIKKPVARIVIIGYLLALIIFSSLIIILFFSNGIRNYFCSEGIPCPEYAVLLLIMNFCLLFENFFFLYAFIFRVRLLQQDREKAVIASEQKEQEKQYLQQLEVQKTRLYTNITHEFRTPLTIIAGMAEQITNTPTTELQTHSDMIKRNSNQLLQLVNQMLDLSKLESGNLSIDWVQDDLVTYLKYLIEPFYTDSTTKQITIHIETPTNLLMDFDPEKIKIIVTNLMSNALKFTTSRGNVYVRLRQQEQYCLLEIADTGIGIEAKHLPHIFDRFYQADDSVTRQADGTGIGLALTKELVTLLGGKIDVNSQIDVGTTFQVQLPITQKANKTKLSYQLEEKPQLQQIVNTSTVNDTAKEIVLLIEDNEDVVTYLKTCLQDRYQIEVAQDGEAGMAKAVSIIPDLIISDVMMPKKDGFEVCFTLKQDERSSHIPIVLLTAKADDASRHVGLKTGADAYIVKPFDRIELEIRLQQLIALRQRLKEKYSSASLEKIDVHKEQDPELLFLKKLEQVVLANLSNESFRVEPDLCQAMLMSRSQLYRKLKALKAVSPSQFIRSIRLEEARRLLQTGKWSVGEVVEQIGFKDHSYFTKVYLTTFGEMPSKVSPISFKDIKL